MKDKRYKEIMEQLGYANSQSLLIALQQVADEAGQEYERKNIDYFSNAELIAELIRRNYIGDAPKSTNREGKHFEVLIGIDPDNTAHLTMTDEVLDLVTME